MTTTTTKYVPSRSPSPEVDAVWAAKITGTSDPGPEHAVLAKHRAMTPPYDERYSSKTPDYDPPSRSQSRSASRSPSRSPSPSEPHSCKRAKTTAAHT